MFGKWPRPHRPTFGSSSTRADGPARDSADYQRAHREARQLVAAYLQEITVTRSAQNELAWASIVPSARIALARRSAA
ncbi:MAG TPA: hypothetical protein VHC45_14155 [Gaiellaceae bacterium]|nr:hypothetical protein [Gaiellaceae bacterium]